ncbi:MAG TPA: sulfatase-like hydrolase/transferase [Polyangia bacterium]|nr:sulfatase-like hydrolase/transferase [Polyangia bacterium]
MSESPTPRLTIGTGALAGGLAGALVGFGDGIRAALLVGTGLRLALATAALAASVDAVLGVGVGAAVELVGRIAVWGRRARAPGWARVVAFLLAGGAAAAAAAAAVAMTAQRHNRFLAAGLTALAALAAAIGGVVLAPAAARVLAAGQARPEPMPAPGPAAILLSPLAVAVLGAVIFFPLAQTRWLAGAALTHHTFMAAAPALLLPLALAMLAELRLPIRWRPALLLATLVYGGVAAFAIARAWSDNLRFAPWTAILVGVLAAAVAGALAWTARGRFPDKPMEVALVAIAVWFAAIGVALRVSPLEGPRKVAGARAAFVTDTLEAGRRLLDFDGDGYARALGGGDCNDHDPLVHPGAPDIPGDGIDSDCDGDDATDPLPPPAQMAQLPDTVPPNLNLLLVTIDTLRADHLGSYGYPRATSPVIDALAGEGALFENGWAHAPSTRYSMPAIASGRWPSAITWDESIWWPRLGPDVRTTAQALHAAGYFTGAMFSFNYFALGDHRGFERGVDDYHAERAALHVAVNGPMESHGSSSREITDDAIAFVNAHRDQKFFLWVHYYDPHLAYETHPEVPPFGSSRIDGYDGEIRFTDLHLGRLIAHLRAAGLWDRTAVILTGDHGEGFGEHGVTEHGFDLYPAQTKVPFIVRVPGVAPRRVRAPAGHVDIAPTLVNLARAPSETTFIGRSLIPDVIGPPAADTDTRAVFQEVTSERGKKRAFVTTSRHLVWNATPGDTTECYDRTRDPAEEHDIWQQGDDGSCAALARTLKRLVAALALPQGAAEKLARGVTPAGATPPPPPAHPLQAALGDAILVRGYDISAASLRAGDTVDVTAHFQAGKPLPAGWRLFFHLEGPAGYRNLDHVPVEGMMPLERWRTGQLIRDRQRIPIPPGAPPGTYTMYVGAYLGAQRLPVTPAALSDGTNRLRLLSFTVTGVGPSEGPTAPAMGSRGQSPRSPTR